MVKDPKELDPDTVSITLNMIQDVDLRATLAWHFSGKMGEKMEDDMRQVAEGIMFLIANQMDDLIQIGANVEEGRRREPFNEKGNIIPFPTTPTKH
tara:strand:+ start:1553 stop:1840 length:288 start_codon:yes stop_codon:yes gene_type:complete